MFDFCQIVMMATDTKPSVACSMEAGKMPTKSLVWCCQIIIGLAPGDESENK